MIVNHEATGWNSGNIKFQKLGRPGRFKVAVKHRYLVLGTWQPGYGVYKRDAELGKIESFDHQSIHFYH